MPILTTRRLARGAQRGSSGSVRVRAANSGPRLMHEIREITRHSGNLLRALECSARPNFGRRHRRGMMIDNEPNVTILHVSEPIPSWPTLGFPVLQIRKCIVASFDRGGAVHTYQLLSKGHLEARKSLEGAYEVIPLPRGRRAL